MMIECPECKKSFSSIDIPNLGNWPIEEEDCPFCRTSRCPDCDELTLTIDSDGCKACGWPEGFIDIDEYEDELNSFNG